MPNPTIITGGPGSGKTNEAVSRLAARYEVDPFSEAVVLVPTVRHGDQFRRRLVGRCGVALRLRVETIAQFSRGLVPGIRSPSNALVEELLTRTARREVERGPAPYFKPIARTGGFSDLLSAAIWDILAEAIEPQALLAASERSGSPSLTALGAIFAAYSSELEQRGWLHPAQIALAATGAVQAGAALPPAIVLDGFQLFRGGELALLEALANRSEVTVTFDPSAGARARHDYERLLSRALDAEVVKLQGSAAAQPETVIAGEAADREGQLRAIARQIKQRLTDNPLLRPSDCAVTFRQVSPYLSLARQVFHEYDLPLDPAAGERLSARPLGVWLRRLLHLAGDGWRLRDVAAVLSGGFVDLGRWQLSRDLVAQFARRGREAHLWAGWDALARTIEGLRADADASTSDSRRAMLRRTADGMASALEELCGLLENPPSPIAEHARRLDEALFGRQAIIGPGSRELPGAGVELDALRGYLQDLASVHKALGDEPEPFESFVARLERQLDAPAVLLREAGGVLLAPMHTLHGLRFDFVAAGGLIEGEFPAPQTTAALLDGSARDALSRAGLALPPEPRLAEDELWASVRTRADDALGLWKTRLDDRGRPAAASYYYHSVIPNEVVKAGTTTPQQAASPRELAVACTQQWPTGGGLLRPAKAETWPVVRSAVAVEQLRRSFGHAGVYEGRLAAELVPWLVGGDVTWSATRLESYRTCAFQFFGQYALRLRELEEQLDGADAAIRGSVIHQIMQDVLAPLVAQGRPLTPDVLDEAVARLRVNGPRIWNQAPKELGFGRAALWRLDAEAIFEQLELLLQHEAEWSAQSGVTRIIGAEKQLEAFLPLDPPLRVTATIDRLDAGEDFVVIVDYKSGREIPRSHVLDGRRVQLQLYGYLAREEAKAGRVIARYAWLDPSIRRWDIDSSREEDAPVVDNVVAVAQGVRSSVKSGDFRVNPQVQPCPTYCSFRHACRVNEFSRWKHWD